MKPDGEAPDSEDTGAAEAEALAQRRFAMMNLARFASVVPVLAGIAMTRGVIAGPQWLGIALAALGVAAFFFAPPLLVRRWKADEDRAQ